MKKIDFAFFLSVLLLLTVACQSTETPTESLKPMTFEEIYPGVLTNVSKIEMRHGGGELKVFTDKKIIIEWLDGINDIIFVPDDNQEGRVGYKYYVKIFEGEELKLTFDTSQINDFYYKRNDQFLESLDLLFNQ